jgi:hypothetical protein
MKLTSLNQEQLTKVNDVRNYWLDYIFSCKNSIDRAKANVQIEWLYKFCKLNKPIIIYIDSPMGAQLAANYLKVLMGPDQVGAQVGAQVWDQVGAQVWDQVRAQVRDQDGAQVRAQVRDQVWAQVWDQVRAQVCDQVGAQVGAQVWDQVGAQVWDQVRAQVCDQVGAQVGAQVRDQVWAQVWDQVGAQVWDQVRAQVRDQVGAQVRAQVRDQVWAQVWDQVGAQGLKFESFSSYGSINDYNWVSFFDFFTQIGVINHKDFNEFRSLLQCGIYDTIQLKGFCIVSDLPSKISRSPQNRLHCEDGPAIQFKDGYSQYYWNGVSVPAFWISDKSLITKDVIKKETNAERRRCLREILGATKYFSLLGGVVEIDRDTDDQGNEMVLYRSKTKDDIISKHIQYLQVVCPSTKREYILYPPNQSSTNVWDAKASTFQNQKIQIRHGDVGLLNLKKEYAKPLLES